MLVANNQYFGLGLAKLQKKKGKKKDFILLYASIQSSEFWTALTISLQLTLTYNPQNIGLF